jgi:hypothetical protein
MTTERTHTLYREVQLRLLTPNGVPHNFPLSRVALRPLRKQRWLPQYKPRKDTRMSGSKFRSTAHRYTGPIDQGLLSHCATLDHRQSQVKGPRRGLARCRRRMERGTMARAQEPAPATPDPAR